ncbi:hypothetical protein BH18ACT17_BH18ACT17_10290 [soil metagenome]
MAGRYLAAFALAAVCLVCLAAGLAIDRGTTLVGVAVVAAVLSLMALADGTLRRARAGRGPRAAG